jgi:hypothetical protein
VPLYAILQENERIQLAKVQVKIQEKCIENSQKHVTGEHGGMARTIRGCVFLQQK